MKQQMETKSTMPAQKNELENQMIWHTVCYSVICTVDTGPFVNDSKY